MILFSVFVKEIECYEPGFADPIAVAAVVLTRDVTVAALAKLVR